MAGGHTLNIKQGPGPRNRRHPQRIRKGQRFFPLAGLSRQRFTVKKLDGEWVGVEREDGSMGRISIDRLLKCDGDGNGLHYRFHGWRRLPRGYRTDLEIVRIAWRERRCIIRLPEWDPAAEVEIALSELPPELRHLGATGSCRADLTATSAAGLALHGLSPGPTKGLSRGSLEGHPEFLASGQEYRRRADGKKFRILEVESGSPTVPAWSGNRVVRLDVKRLLAREPDDEGRHYRYLGGGRTVTRRRLADQY